MLKLLDYEDIEEEDEGELDNVLLGKHCIEENSEYSDDDMNEEYESEVLRYDNRLC